MKVKEVRFEKLFSLEKYNNERIGFVAEVEEGENPDKVAGALHFKILEIEDCFAAYRNILYEIDHTSRRSEELQSHIRHTKERMRDLKVTLQELMAKAEKGDVDSKLRHACERESYKELSESLKRYEEKLRETDEQLKKLVEARETLKQRIKNGDFSLKGIEIPKKRYPDYV